MVSIGSVSRVGSKFGLGFELDCEFCCDKNSYESLRLSSRCGDDAGIGSSPRLSGVVPSGRRCVVPSRGPEAPRDGSEVLPVSAEAETNSSDCCWGKRASMGGEAAEASAGPACVGIIG